MAGDESVNGDDIQQIIINMKKTDDCRWNSSSCVMVKMAI